MLDRAAVTILEGLGNRLWGFRPRLMAALVSEHGGLRMLGWFLRHMPRYERTRKQLGAQRTHLLTTAISLEGGCAYCAFGHGHAMELLHLRDQNALFPLPMAEVLALRGQERAAITARLAEALRAADRAEDVEWLERLHAPDHGGDPRLAHLIAMFAVLNSAGVACDVAPDEAHDPINKDVALKQRLVQLRAQQVGD